MKKRMNRRNFLRKGMLAVIVVMAGGFALTGFAGVAGCSDAKKQEKRIGLQLYSLRAMMKEDPKATLEAVAKMGYKELETAGYKNGKLYGFDAAEFGRMAKDLGMNVSSCHLRRDWDPEKADEIWAWWDEAIRSQAAAGCRYLFMSSMPIPETLAGVQEYCDYFNRIGEMAKQHGLTFGFHNHAKEFTEIEGQMMYDYLIRHTDPDKVAFQMDVYWVQRGGQSPVEYLNKYPGRFPVLHIKDVDIIGASGELDFKAIFEAAYAQGMKDYYVEIEGKNLPFAPEVCVERSFEYLNNADFVK